jgi:hypothetical protein
VAYGYTLFLKKDKITKYIIFFDKMIRITENEMFPEMDALPTDWSFIIEPNQEAEIIHSAQIKVKCEEETRRISLNPSTLTGEYSLVQLNRLIISTFNLSKNSSLDLFCHQTQKNINTDIQLLQAINSNQFDKSPLQIDASLSKQEDPCLLCLSYECCHKTSQRSLIKKRKLDDHDTLLPEIGVQRKQESPKTPPRKTKKRRLIHLSTSMPKLPMNASFGATSTFFPFEVPTF